MGDLPPAKIVLVDDHPIVRHGLAMLLQQRPGWSIVGQAGSAAEALEVVGAADPDLVIVDLGLGDGPDGIQLIKAMLSESPDRATLMLSGVEESLFAERALEAGARGYLMKDNAVETLQSAVEAVLEGRLYLSDAIRARLQAPDGPDPDLAPDDHRVLQAMGTGATTTRAIAMRLDQSLLESEQLVADLRRKLALGGAVQLLLYAESYAHAPPGST